MSWDSLPTFLHSLATSAHGAIVVAVSLALLLGLVALRRRRLRNDRHDATSPPAAEDEDTRMVPDETTLPDDYEQAKDQIFVTEVEDPDLDEMPPFNSLSTSNERPEPFETDDVSKAVPTDIQAASSAAADPVPEQLAAPAPDNGADGAHSASAVLFRLLSTKAQICELERAERSKSAALESTSQVLERLKGSLNDSSAALRDEIEEMHELIEGELSTTRQSFLSVLELKEIINTQCDLLKQPESAHSAEFLSSKLKYVETIDASLERRLKAAERREREFEQRKGRIITLRKEMLNLLETQDDSAPHH